MAYVTQDGLLNYKNSEYYYCLDTASNNIQLKTGKHMYVINKMIRVGLQSGDRL